MERQVKMERDRLWSVAGQYLIRTDNCTVLYCTVPWYSGLVGSNDTN